MKAIVYSSDRSRTLRYEEVERPTAEDDEVLIKVCAASANTFDWRLAGAHPYIRRAMTAVRKTKIRGPGIDLAGQVEAVGKNVTRFRPGDEVFGMGRGSFAEYACAGEDRLAPKPANLTLEQAAAVPIAAITALQGLRDKGRIQAGQRVLINGASGAVGPFAVQIAKSFGANVTAVCGTRNVDMVRSIGADDVIDYTQDDFTRSGQRYDLLFDCAGNHSLSACRRALTAGGTLVLVGSRHGHIVGPLIRVLRAPLLSPFVSQNLVVCMASAKADDLVVLKDLIEAGRVTPIIDRRYTLAEVPEALRYLEEGHARGKVVITVEPLPAR